MEIKVISRSKRKREFLSAVSAFYSKSLKLRRRKFNVTLRTVPGFFSAHGAFAGTTLLDEKHVEMAIDPKLSAIQMIEVLAHEFIHVEQFVLGFLSQYVKRSGDYGWIWKGKKNRCKYENQPWEIDAFARQKGLVNKIIDILNKG